MVYDHVVYNFFVDFGWIWEAIWQPFGQHFRSYFSTLFKEPLEHHKIVQNDLKK